jgi:hypothetical protein
MLGLASPIYPVDGNWDGVKSTPQSTHNDCAKTLFAGLLLQCNPDFRLNATVV